jgi:small subunit ribosomal protein S6
MKKYEAVLILNPNLSAKVNSFLKEFESILKKNSFSIKKTEDIGRRQLSYSINNHNKGHYVIFNIEGDASRLIDIENKIKFNELIIRHLFIAVKEHQVEDSELLLDAKNKKSDVKDIDEKKHTQKEKEDDDKDE